MFWRKKKKPLRDESEIIAFRLLYYYDTGNIHDDIQEKIDNVGNNPLDKLILATRLLTIFQDGIEADIKEFVKHAAAFASLDDPPKPIPRERLFINLYIKIDLVERFKYRHQFWRKKTKKHPELVANLETFKKYYADYLNRYPEMGEYFQLNNHGLEINHDHLNLLKSLSELMYWTDRAWESKEILKKTFHREVLTKYQLIRYILYCDFNDYP
jgi:hypothetical protein